MWTPKTILLGLALLASATLPSAAATALSVVVLAPTGEPVAGAQIEVDGRVVATTNENGAAEVASAVNGVELRVLHPAYRELRQWVASDADRVELQLDWIASVQESVTVTGVRASDDAPVTTHNIDRETIEEESYGQDVPELLSRAPAMNWTSDSGTGANYTYFSIRGIQQSRIAMTFDGAPLNDPAEHAVFFNNFHDFASAVDSIQIQRGVGTSTVGSPAYGGSVNFASRPPSRRPAGEAKLVVGSYATARASVGYQTGVFDNGVYAGGRVSVAKTDGYRDRSSSAHRTFFVDAGWQGQQSSLTFVSFSGSERSQLAYLAVDPDTLRTNRRFNPLTEDDRDEFGQDFAQLKYARELGADTLMTASIYYNGADGWFQLWDDPAVQNERWRFGIDQGAVGGMGTLSTRFGAVSATAGAHYSDFSGDHFLDTETGGRRYANTGFKKTANAFVKIAYELGDASLFGDVHTRWADFRYDGDVDLGSVRWRFFDPKIGVRYAIAPGLSVYGSIGRAQREPARLDLLLGEDNATRRHDLEAVRPESVVDVETGVNWNTPRVALRANAYFMEFRDEIALTGELSDVGLPLRRNVDESYRRGVELDLRWLLTPNWTITQTLNVSRNRIRRWTQFYDVFDADGTWIDSEPIVYENVRPLLTPEALVNVELQWSSETTAVAVSGRGVAGAQLDNTGLAGYRTPAFTSVDLRASQQLNRWIPGVDVRAVLFVRNVLDNRDQLPGGYSYQFLTRDGAGRDTFDGIPFYYPLATRNVTFSLEIDF